MKLSIGLFRQPTSTACSTVWYPRFQGGRTAKAWLALALAQQPEVLLLDEPTTFLDIGCQFEVLELIKSLNAQLGITIVMVLHDINQAARYSKSIIALKDRRVYKMGRPEEIVTEKVLEEVFNVKVKVFSDSHNNCSYFIPVSGSNECVPGGLAVYKKMIEYE